jgi:DegV family protein with EDD domain
VDIQPIEFYRLLAQTGQYPSTSMPAIQDFVSLYRRLAKIDPQILSIHVSSGLSGTHQTALMAAEMVPEAQITVVDSRSLSALLGWQVEAAARAIQAGWPKEKILALLDHLRKETFGFLTVKEMRYLVHSGRVEVIKGLFASMLHIKPILAVNQILGKLDAMGREMTFRRAIEHIALKIHEKFGKGVLLRAQIVHGDNLVGVEMLKFQMDKHLSVQWEPVTAISPVLGAHSGPSIVGVAVAPEAVFSEIAG